MTATTEEETLDLSEETLDGVRSAAVEILEVALSQAVRFAGLELKIEAVREQQGAGRRGLSITDQYGSSIHCLMGQDCTEEQALLLMESALSYVAVGWINEQMKKVDEESVDEADGRD